MESFKVFLEEYVPVGKTLYHGSAISKFGGQPLNEVILVGGGDEDGDSMIDKFYGDEYGDEDDRDTPVFAADKETLQGAASAMAHAVATSKDKTMWDVTELDIRADGVLFIFYNGDDAFDRYDAHEYSDAMEEFKGLEDGDYYGEGMGPDAYIIGKKLVQFLRRHGIKFNK